MATEAIAELPSPCRGIESSRPTSPQHISMIDSTEARLAPFLYALLSLRVALSRRTPAAPAPLDAPDSESPSIIAASMSSSMGYSCSARVVLAGVGPQHVHRDLVGLVDERPELLGGLEVDGHQTEHPPSMTPIGSEVAVPPLHRVLLDEAVAAEQLHAVDADLHALLGAQPAGQRDLAGERLALRGTGRGPVGHQPHALQLDADVGDHEGDRSAGG